MQWESAIHQTTLWSKAVTKGKQLLELNAPGLEGCLEDMVTPRQSAVIIKLRWLQHHVSVIQAQAASLKSEFIGRNLAQLIEMYDKEFDLKASLSLQWKGSVNKRRLIAHCWVMEPHINDKFLQGLPKSLKTFSQ